MNKFLKPQTIACLFSLFTLFGVSTSTMAANIVLINNDGAAEGFNDPAPAVPGQTGNTGITLGDQRLQVFQAAADYWEARLVLTVDVRVGINFNPLTCFANRATLGSAGAATLFRDFPGAPMSSTLYVAALANNLAGRRLSSNPNAVDINATFNSDIDNNDDCLRGTNWWLGINSSAPNGTISLFDTVLHEIGHGLGVSSGIRQNGQLLNGFIDAYAYFLYDETQGDFWRNLTVAERVTSATNTGNVTFRGPNVMSNTGHINTGKNGGQLQIYAPNPYQNGSSISHWDTALAPDELMEPSATPTSDDRATLQMLKDIGWQLAQDQVGPPPVVGTVALVDDQLSIIENEGPLTINVQRTGGSDGAVSVRVRSQAITATANSDYNIINQVVNWADGETGIKSVTLAINNDSATEGNETLDVILSEPSGGVVLGNADVRVTISDPAPVPGRVEFVRTNELVDEGSGSVNVQVQRIEGDDGQLEVSVRFTDDTATQSADYTPPITTNIVWLDGESGTRNLSITLIDDADVEGNESTNLTLSAITPGANVSSRGFRLTITDNDQTPPPPTEPGSIEFVSTSASVSEADGSVEIPLQRVGGTDGRIEVDLIFFDTTASVTSDYTRPSSTRLVWEEGQSGIRSISLDIVDDTVVEGDEFTDILIQAISAGASVSSNRLRLIITDNDQALPAPAPTPTPPANEEFNVLEAIVPILGAINAQKQKKREAEQKKESKP